MQGLAANRVGFMAILADVQRTGDVAGEAASSAVDVACKRRLARQARQSWHPKSRQQRRHAPQESRALLISEQQGSFTVSAVLGRGRLPSMAKPAAVMAEARQTQAGSSPLLNPSSSIVTLTPTPEDDDFAESVVAHCLDDEPDDGIDGTTSSMDSASPKGSSSGEGSTVCSTLASDLGSFSSRGSNVSFDEVRCVEHTCGPQLSGNATLTAGILSRHTGAQVPPWLLPRQGKTGKSVHGVPKTPAASGAGTIGNDSLDHSGPPQVYPTLLSSRSKLRARGHEVLLTAHEPQGIKRGTPRMWNDFAHAGGIASDSCAGEFGPAQAEFHGTPRWTTGQASDVEQWRHPYAKSWSLIPNSCMGVQHAHESSSQTMWEASFEDAPQASDCQWMWR